MQISIHVPREGDDNTSTIHILAGFLNFYPRPPRGGRPSSWPTRCAARKFLSTSPARGTTFQLLPHLGIHGISIHVPREGDDLAYSASCGARRLFLSTSPARGTTGWFAKIKEETKYFYPRPPRGGRPAQELRIIRYIRFLSTSPARGTTAKASLTFLAPPEFLSTSPARGTTRPFGGNQLHVVISIHVPREGDDATTPPSRSPKPNFYPRPPRGGRPFRFLSFQRVHAISIHVPREGDDVLGLLALPVSPISIHVPREGDDTLRYSAIASTSISIHVPREGDDERPAPTGTKALPISIHVPREGDDFACALVVQGGSFLSTSPARGTTPRGYKSHYSAIYFYPRPPRGGRQQPVCHPRRPGVISIHVPREGDDASAHAGIDSA